MEQSGTLLAISVDPVGDNSRVANKNRLDFPILSDEQRDVVWEYGVLHQGAGPGGSDVSLPAMVLIDCSGTIIWRHVSQRIQDRPTPEAVLKLVSTLDS